jgi:hypothetical protein
MLRLDGRKKMKALWEKIPISIVYLAYSAFAALGLLLLRIFIGPYLGKIISWAPLTVGSQVSVIYLVAIFSLPSAVLAGVTFGVALGLWETRCSGRKAFWVAMCAGFSFLTFAMLLFKLANRETNRFDWLYLSAEALIFVVVLALTATGLSRLTFITDVTVRRTISMFLLGAFFTALLFLGEFI